MHTAYHFVYMEELRLYTEFIFTRFVRSLKTLVVQLYVQFRAESKKNERVWGFAHHSSSQENIRPSMHTKRITRVFLKYIPNILSCTSPKQKTNQKKLQFIHHH